MVCLCVFSELFEICNTGINFDKYADIPVEATGTNSPAPIDQVSQQKISKRFASHALCTELNSSSLMPPASLFFLIFPDFLT